MSNRLFRHDHLNNRVESSVAQEDNFVIKFEIPWYRASYAIKYVMIKLVYMFNESRLMMVRLFYVEKENKKFNLNLSCKILYEKK